MTITSAPSTMPCWRSRSATARPARPLVALALASAGVALSMMVVSAGPSLAPSRLPKKLVSFISICGTPWVSGPSMRGRESALATGFEEAGVGEEGGYVELRPGARLGILETLPLPGFGGDGVRGGEVFRVLQARGAGHQQGAMDTVPCSDENQARLAAGGGEARLVLIVARHGVHSALLVSR